MPVPLIPVVLESDTAVVRAGQSFEVRVRVEAGSDSPVDTVQVYLEFDPAKLQVVSISPGPRLEYLLQSTWDGETGRIVYAAGTLGDPARSPFTLCTMTLRVAPNAENTNAQVWLVGRESIHRTKVIRRGLDITGQLSPLEIFIR